jgi:3-oxoacyl-[acyl-carrier protein] reductase
MMKKYVLVTGASGGIGSAIAMKLAEEGYHLYLHYYQGDTQILALIENLNKYQGEYIPIQGDLSHTSDIGKVCSSIMSLDAIVHCSGFTHYGLFTDIHDGDMEKLMNVHITSPLLLTKMLLPKLLAKRKGNIIFISSIWGQTGAACEVVYSTVKGAQNAFVKALSKEVALNGIRVNAIAPGAIETRMNNHFTGEELSLLQEEIPMGRLGKPEEVANGVSFLLGDNASYITGQVIAINGGWYI